MEKIPILLYHDLCSETNKAKDNFAVTWDSFKQQMEYLHKNGFVAVSVAKMMAEAEYWKSENALSKPSNQPIDSRKKVILTFDDGDLSNYHYVLPTLKEMGFTATFFVTINEIGKDHKMDWSMIYDLTKNGMDVGSHGLTHTFLTAHNDYTILNELLTSKQILEKYTRKRVNFLSVPQGFYNKRLLAIAQDIGFKAVCVSDAGYSDMTTADCFLLKRFTMRKNYNLKAFKSIIHGSPQLTIAAAENLRSSLRKLLGWQVYDKLRRIRYREKKITVE